jgi:7-cyano-7-deazaguanine synthase
VKAIVVLSGGMDSSTALAWAKANGHSVVGAIHFQYGSKHNAKELVAASAIAQHYGAPLTAVDLSFMGNLFKSDLLKSGGPVPEGHYADESMKKTVVPFRNGIMLSVAAGFAESVGAEAVILGNHFGDHAIYPDCRAEFIHHMRRAVYSGTYANIEILSPFCSIDKTAIAGIGADLGVPFELTWTCYKGGDEHCGKCGSCVERREAFQLAGVPDPTVYAAGV